MAVGNERPCEESDLKGYLLSTGSRLRNLTLIFEQIVSNLRCDDFHANKRINKGCTVYLLLLCGEHSADEKWTTRETIKYSGELIRHLYKLWQCQSVQLLTGVESRQDFVGPFSTALLSLRPKLLKDTWKTYPAAVSCCQWLMFQVKVSKVFMIISAICIANSFSARCH